MEFANDYIKNVFNQQEYKLSFLQENIETISYSIVCFFIPFFLGHPQLLVGSLVNCALILGALNLRNYKVLPIIMLPSLGVLSAGLIFGSFTRFLVYMIPLIWAGNLVLVYAFKKLNLDMKMNRWLVLAVGTLAKVVLLFGVAYVLVNTGVLPQPFLAAMGMLQIYTALIGGVMAFTIQSTKRKLLNF